MLKKSLHTYLLLVLTTSTSVFAQFYAPQFSKPGRSNGHETSFPTDLVVDNSYRYWITSFNGLIEYEGKAFKSHHLPPVQNGLPGSDYLQQMVQTNDSTLWIAHANGIATFNLYRKTFQLIPIRDCKPGTSLNFIQGFVDSKNRPVFVCNELGPVYFNAATQQVERLEGPAKAANTFIFKLTETADKQHYLLHTRRGFMLYHLPSQKILHGGDLPEAFRWIERKELSGVVTDYLEIAGKKYISVKDSADAYYDVLEYHAATQSFRSLGLKSNKGRLFFGDSQQRLWIFGFGDQPVLYDPKSAQLYRLPVKSLNPSIEFSLCYHVMEDHENTIWLCTNAGIFTYNLFQNTCKILSETLPLNVFSDIAQVSPTSIWFGTLQNGIYEYDARTQKFRNRNYTALCNDAAYNDIWQIHKAADNKNIWVIHANAKISRYNIASQQYFFYKNAAFEGDFLSICDNDEGDLFVATQNGAMFRYNTKTDQFDSLFHVADITGIHNDLEVNDIVSISKDELLLATSGEGLIKLNLQTRRFKIFRFDPDKPESLRSNIINVLKKFDEEVVYAGTSNGIFAYHISTEKIESFSYDERFNLGNVFQITQDKYRNLIFTGTNKMYILNWKTKDVIDLGQKSNIENNNLTEVYYSDNLERLFVLSAESIFEIQLKDKLINPRIQPVIYSVESNGNTHYVTNSTDLYLQSPNNSFQINYGSSSFKFRDDLEYFYSLNSDEWLRTESPYINFSKLPGGDYVFKLKVLYTGNRKIQGETFLNIHIQKKFHETIWFYLMIIVLTFSLVYLIYRIRLNRLLAVEKVRFQLSRDLHDDMGSTLSTINILSAIAGDKLDADPASARQYIQRISQNSQQMMESMDDIVWSINPANDSMKRVVYRMREFASGILEPKGIELHFESEESLQDLKLNMAHRRDFYLIFKEAINNSVKYSGCTKLRVRFYTEGSFLVLEVKDNGTGFNPTEFQDGNGLVNMRKRAAAIRAQFKLQSAPGEGTAIEIRLKLKQL